MQFQSHMKRIIIFCIIVLSISSVIPLPVSAYDLSDEQSVFLDYSNHSITMFYNSHCGSCKAAIIRIEGLSENYPDLEVHMFNTYNSSQNMTLLSAFGEKYNCSFPGVPSVFAGEITFFQGFTAIDEHIDEIAEALQRGDIPSGSFEARWIESETDEPIDMNGSDSTKLSYSLVAGAGLMDGINPCAFAVLVFLLAGFMTAGSRRTMVVTGISYTAGVFVFYFLSGMGIFTVVQTGGFVSGFTFFAAAVALIAGMIQLADGFSGKKTLRLALPDMAFKRLKNLASRASLASAFIMGMVVGIFELPCTGGIYIAVLGLLSSTVTFTEGIHYLLLYNLMFILPLLLITAAVAYGLPPGRIEDWRVQNRNSMKIIMGAVMVVLGLYLVYSVFFFHI